MVKYCCNCGEPLANSVHNETGAHSKVEAFICSECDWEEYCNSSKHSYCSECGEWLPTSKEFEQHILNHK